MTEKKGNAAVAAIAAIMKTVGAVEKAGKNDFHKYNYATAADVAHALQVKLGEHGLVIVQDEVERELLGDNALFAVTYEFAVLHESGDILPTSRPPRFTGLSAASKAGKDTVIWDDKGISKCHTAARKYFTLALFQIPTGDYPDNDADGDVSTGKKAAPKVPTPMQPPKQSENNQLRPTTPSQPLRNAVRGPQFSVVDHEGVEKPVPTWGAYLEELGALLKDAPNDAMACGFVETNYPQFEGHLKACEAEVKRDPSAAEALKAFRMTDALLKPYLVPPPA